MLTINKTTSKAKNHVGLTDFDTNVVAASVVVVTEQETEVIRKLFYRWAMAKHGISLDCVKRKYFNLLVQDNDVFCSKALKLIQEGNKNN